MSHALAMMLPMGSPTTLYRLFDEGGVLLYIGIAGNPGRRLDDHAGDKPWWGEVASATMAHFPSRDAARDAEVAAIRAENPRYNIAELPREHDDTAPPTFDVTVSGKPVPHGQPGTYRHHGCSCGPCMKAHRDWMNESNRARRERLRADPSAAPHGRVHTYSGWGCRCEECKEAARQARASRRRTG